MLVTVPVFVTLRQFLFFLILQMSLQISEAVGPRIANYSQFGELNLVAGIEILVGTVGAGFAGIPALLSV